MINDETIKKFSSKEWTDVFQNPPRYFWDEESQTLGLDGDWTGNGISCPNISLGDLGFEVNCDITNNIDRNLNIYLGDNFYDKGYIDEVLFSYGEVTVSPANKHFKSIKGVLFSNKDNKPYLSPLGSGFYEIYRDGKWGIVDKDLNAISLCIYDWINYLDCNGLFQVDIDTKHGCLDSQGNEVIPVIYDTLRFSRDGIYELTKGDVKYYFDSKGNKLGQI